MTKHRNPSDLTRRERELVQFLVQGMSNAAIASQMDISLNTVKTHLKHIYSKMEVQNRQELIVNMLTK